MKEGKQEIINQRVAIKIMGERAIKDPTANNHQEEMEALIIRIRLKLALLAKNHSKG